MDGALGRQAASAAAGGRSLDQRKELPSGDRWVVTCYPEAGEATLTFCPGIPSGESDWSQLGQEERDRRNRAKAVRDARKRSRLYVVANRLRYMWVLTFEGAGLHGAVGRAVCMAEVAAFAERLRAEVGGLPYWFSPELHPGGHGWHVNFFVGRRIKIARVNRLWAHGHVWVKDWTKDSRVQMLHLTVLEAIRLGAEYGCKYASKDWGEDVVIAGAHRYEVAQGFAPRRLTYRVPHLRVGEARIRDVFGPTPPAEVWHSDQLPDWDGPPVMCLRWSSVPDHGGSDG